MEGAFSGFDSPEFKQGGPKTAERMPARSVATSYGPLPPEITEEDWSRVPARLQEEAYTQIAVAIRNRREPREAFAEILKSLLDQ